MALPWKTRFENIRRELVSIEEEAEAIDVNTQQRVSSFIKRFSRGPEYEEDSLTETGDLSRPADKTDVDTGITTTGDPLSQPCDVTHKGGTDDDEITGKDSPTEHRDHSKLEEETDVDIRITTTGEPSSATKKEENRIAIIKDSPIETGYLPNPGDKTNEDSGTAMTEEPPLLPDGATKEGEDEMANMTGKNSPTETGDLSKPDDKTNVDTGISRTEEPSPLPGDVSKEGEDKLADMPVQDSPTEHRNLSKLEEETDVDTRITTTGEPSSATKKGENRIAIIKDSPKEIRDLPNPGDKTNEDSDITMTEEPPLLPDGATKEGEYEMADMPGKDSPTWTEDLSKPDDKTNVDIGISRTDEPSPLPGDVSKEGQDELADMPVKNGRLLRLISTEDGVDGGERFHSCVSFASTPSTSIAGTVEVTEQIGRLSRLISTEDGVDGGERFHSCVSFPSTPSTSIAGTVEVTEQEETARIDLDGDHGTIKSQASDKCVCGHNWFDSLQDARIPLMAIQCQNCCGAWVIPLAGDQPANKNTHLRANGFKYYYNPPISNIIPKSTPVTKSTELERGDHMRFDRSGFYYHHAIVLHVFETSVEIIHWTYKGGAVKIDKGVQEIGGNGIHKVVYKHQDFAELVIARALFLMRNPKAEKYDLVQNNCESFAVFCKTGKSLSFQGKALKELCPRYLLDAAAKVAGLVLDG